MSRESCCLLRPQNGKRMRKSCLMSRDELHFIFILVAIDKVVKKSIRPFNAVPPLLHHRLLHRLLQPPVRLIHHRPAIRTLHRAVPNTSGASSCRMDKVNPSSMRSARPVKRYPPEAAPSVWRPPPIQSAIPPSITSPFKPC